MNNEAYWTLIETHLQSAKADDRAWFRTEFQRVLKEIDTLQSEVMRLNDMILERGRIIDSNDATIDRLREALEKVQKHMELIASNYSENYREDAFVASKILKVALKKSPVPFRSEEKIRGRNPKDHTECVKHCCSLTPACFPEND